MADGSKFTCEVTVLVNTKADIILDAAAPGSVRLDGNNYKRRLSESDKVIYTVGSGTYTFVGR